MAKNEDTPAKWAVIKEWDAWVSKHGEEARIGDGMFFFAYLQRECPTCSILNTQAINGRPSMDGC